MMTGSNNNSTPTPAPPTPPAAAIELGKLLLEIERMCDISKFSRATLLDTLQQCDLVTRGVLDGWNEDHLGGAIVTTAAAEGAGAAGADLSPDVSQVQPASPSSLQRHQHHFQELLRLALRLKYLADLCSKKFAHVTLNRKIARGVTSIENGIASFANKGAFALTQEEYVSPYGMHVKSWVVAAATTAALLFRWYQYVHSSTDSHVLRT